MIMPAQQTPDPLTAVPSSRQHNGRPEPSRVGQSKSRPTAYIVESRDEVYARLAADAIEAGYRLVRCFTASDALQACAKRQPRLIVAQLAHSCEQAWRLAPRLTMLDGSDTRVVLYAANIAVHDYAMADFLGIEKLIEYGGNLFQLSARMRDILGSKSPEQTESQHRFVPAQMPGAPPVESALRVGPVEHRADVNRIA